MPRLARTIPTLFRSAVDDVPEKAWLHSDDGVLTYAEALGRVDRAASGLRAAGIERGDRVLVTARNTADYLLLWFALMDVGAIQVPVNPAGSDAELAGFVAQVQPKLVVDDARARRAVRLVPRWRRSRRGRRVGRRGDGPYVGYHRTLEARDADASRLRDGRRGLPVLDASSPLTTGS